MPYPSLQPSQDHGGYPLAPLSGGGWDDATIYPGSWTLDAQVIPVDCITLLYNPERIRVHGPNILPALRLHFGEIVTLNGDTKRAVEIGLPANRVEARHWRRSYPDAICSHLSSLTSNDQTLLDDFRRIFAYFGQHPDEELEDASDINAHWDSFVEIVRRITLQFAAESRLPKLIERCKAEMPSHIFTLDLLALDNRPLERRLPLPKMNGISDWQSHEVGE